MVSARDARGLLRTTDRPCVDMSCDDLNVLQLLVDPKMYDEADRLAMMSEQADRTGPLLDSAWNDHARMTYVGPTAVRDMGVMDVRCVPPTAAYAFSAQTFQAAIGQVQR